MATWGVPLQHLHLLLVVREAKQLSLFDDELAAFRESNSAHHTHKARDMKHTVQGSHHVLRRSDAFRTTQALFHVHPGRMRSRLLDTFAASNDLFILAINQLNAQNLV